jgi:formylglycine-generating enzyme required for sulfatase activity
MSFTNSIGMKMVRLLPGKFLMGYSKTPLPRELTLDLPYREEGDYDERPYHYVTITNSFYMSELEVTNEHFEQFDRNHSALRGKLGFSKDDDEAVIFVSWYDANSFSRWLSNVENETYRLPSEAEWEYVARSGGDTYFSTGDSVPAEYQKCQTNSWYPGRAPPCPIPKLTTGQSPANAFGVKDMVGNVEEWTLDWYDWYQADNATDPRGPSSGHFKVTRGGSHSTDLYYLRSANRLGTLPEDNSWYIGFRVVMEDPNPIRLSMDISLKATQRVDVKNHYKPQTFGKVLVSNSNSYDQTKPYFYGPLQYVNIPVNQTHLPFGHHNHDPAVCPCSNGDILAIWYSCWTEPTRELGIVYSRLSKGADQWDTPELFWNAPDRNDHAPAMYLDAEGTIYHFNGLSAAGTWGNLATVMRKSHDCGISWTKADLIFPEHGLKHMPVETTFQTQDGWLVLPTDAVTGGSGSTVLHISKDNGSTWYDPGGSILGIHGAVVQLKNGSLYAVGRGNDINSHMAHSLSNDLGKTWTYSASPFPGIHGGQREVLLRLQEGPIMFIGFANLPMTIVDSSNKTFTGKGLFAAVSYDECETWPIQRLITDDGKGREVETLDGELFIMSYDNAEPVGYVSARQSPVDGIIHVVTSRQHYQFNAKWLGTYPPPPPHQNF